MSTGSGLTTSGKIRDSMKLKHAIGTERLRAAIRADGGTTVYGAHLLPHLAPLLPAIKASGLRILEITHTSIYLQENPPRERVEEGGRWEALKASHAVPVEQLAQRIHQLRPVLGDVFLNVGAPGTFNQIGPSFFSEDTARLLSEAGADGLHVHHSSLEELTEIVTFAHRYGLLVEAYVHRSLGPTHPFSYKGIRAETPADVGRTAREMERLGVDIVGLMFSADPRYYSQRGATDELPRDVRDRVRALARATTVPRSVEGQITPSNAIELRALGVNILVLGTVFDLAIEDAIRRTVEAFRGLASPPSKDG